MLEESRQQHRAQSAAREEFRELLSVWISALALAATNLSVGYWLTTSCSISPGWLSSPSWVQSTMRWCAWLIALGFLAGAGVESWDTWMRVMKAQRAAAQEAFLARSPLREEIRWWLSHLEVEFGWLLETSDDKRREWAVRRFREIVLAWPEEHRRFETMQKSEEFDLALSEVGPPGQRMLKIWNARASLYQWARREVTALERVVDSLETQEEIAKAKVERIEGFESYRKTRQAPLLDGTPDGQEEAG